MGLRIRVWVMSVLLAAPALIFAQTPPPSAGAAMPAPVLGVVDVDEIQQDALSAKAVRAQAAKFQQDFEQQRGNEEAALRTTQQALQQEAKTLSQDVLAAKARAFDASVAEYRRRDLARRRAFEKSFNIAMGKVRDAMNEALRQVAVAHGVNVILPRGQVLLFDDKMNMTKEVIAQMDKLLPSTDFPAPQVEAEQPPPPTSPILKKKN